MSMAEKQGSPLGFVNRLGEQAAEKWLNRPSHKDPTESVGDVLMEEVFADIRGGRSLGEFYLDPVKEGYRRGLIKGAKSRLEAVLLKSSSETE